MAELLDNFTAGGEGLLTAHTADSGEAWSDLTDSSNLPIRVNGLGQAYINDASVSLGIAYSAWTPASANYRVKVTVKARSNSGDIGCTARLTGTTWATSNYYMARYEANIGWQMFKVVNGSYTQLGSTNGAAAPVDGDTLELDCNSTTIQLLKNNSSLISVTDATHSSAGKVGLWIASPMNAGTGYQPDIITTVTSASLAANVASMTALASGTVTIAGTAATGGIDTKSYQLKRGTDGVTFGTNVGSAQVLSGTTAPSAVADTGLTDGTLYYYRWSVTDSAGSPTTVTSNTIKAVPHASGTTFYVDATGGSDNNVGTSTSVPWQTATRANNYMESSILAGDSLSLKGGVTLSGNLRAINATAFTINSYGTGSGTISCGNSYAIWLDECGGTTVTNLILTGSGVSSLGVTTSTDAAFKSTLAGSASLTNVSIIGCTISGSFYGILYSVASGNSNSFVTPTISGNTITQCGFAAIWIRVLPWVTHNTRFTTPTISGNTVYDIYGANNTALTNQGDWPVDTASGYGIIPANCSGGTVSGNLVHDVAAASSASSSGDPPGIMTAETDGMTIRDNEVYNCFAKSSDDGMGIDLDGGSRNCIVERNYVHDCDGPAFFDFALGGFTANSGNTFRFNISQNNGRRIAGAGPGSHPSTLISISGSGATPSNTKVYNNTEYAAKTAGSEANTLACTATTATFRNNIFITSGSGMKFGSLPNGVLLQGNCYRAINGSTFNLVYNSIEKTSLVQLHAAGIEQVSSVDVGIETDPGLASVGAGSSYAIGLANSLLTAYDPSSDAAVVGAGLDLSTLFSVDPGASDFHSRNNHPSSGFVIGACTAVAPDTSSVFGPWDGVIDIPFFNDRLDI